MAARGITLLDAKRNHVFYARVARALDASDSAIAGRVAAFALLRPSDKVHPAIWQRRFEQFEYLDREGGRSNTVRNADGSLTLLVRVYPSLPEADIASLLLRGSISAERLSPIYWRVTVGYEAMTRLAADDRIRWIDAVPRVTRDNDVTRGAVGVTTVQTTDAVTGWTTGLTGAGVQIAINDYGIDDGHETFTRIDATGSATGSRILTNDTRSDWHGTHVAGVAAGNGRNSSGLSNWGEANGGTPHQWVGMAPQAELIEGQAIDLSVPLADLRAHITSLGADVSNHSYFMTYNGEYDPLAARHDHLIRGEPFDEGDPGPPRLHVHSAGNLGFAVAGQYRHGYFSLGTQLKNALVVGSYYVGDERLSHFSSLGPTTDGRLKPDVVAPGSQIWSSGYCAGGPEEAGSYCPENPPTGKSWPLRQLYAMESGTSLAAPATTGVLALVLQEYATTYQVDIDHNPPLPSTLRAILVQTARDLVSGTPSGYPWFFMYPWFYDYEPWFYNDEELPVTAFVGPDFATGYGLINAKAATDLVRSRRIVEDTIPAECATRTYNFFVPGLLQVPQAPIAALSRGSVKVTLAWDDLAGDPADAPSEPKLINDLDVVLVDPLGNKHYPWQLNQVIKDASGTQVLSSAQQTCGTDVTVERELVPSATSGRDPITASQLKPAARGMDHLNNLEQVSTTAIPGRWQAIVTGFRLAGPQTFSLVGITPTAWAAITPRELCDLFPAFCVRVMPDICRRLPSLCQVPTRFRFVNDSIHVRLNEPGDRLIVPFSLACARVSGDPCGVPRDTSGFELTLEHAPIGLALEVFDPAGRLVDSASTQGGVIRALLRPLRDDWLLVFRSRGDAASAVLHVRIRPMPAR